MGSLRCGMNGTQMTLHRVLNRCIMTPAQRDECDEVARKRHAINREQGNKHYVAGTKDDADLYGARDEMAFIRDMFAGQVEHDGKWVYEKGEEIPHHDCKWRGFLTDVKGRKKIFPLDKHPPDMFIARRQLKKLIDLFTFVYPVAEYEFVYVGGIFRQEVIDRMNEWRPSPVSDSVIIPWQELKGRSYL